jgi:hypothetical protein
VRKLVSVVFYVAGPTGHNGRLRERAFRHGFEPAEVGTTLPSTTP